MSLRAVRNELSFLEREERYNAARFNLHSKELIFSGDHDDGAISAGRYNADAA